jgi:predicted DNA-binding transcriptional regulator YafY
MNYQGRWYLIGYCRKKQGKRHFHCSRMRKLRVSPEKRSRQIPANLEDMERGFGIFKGETTRDVRIFFKNEAATVVKYQIWHKEQFMESVPGGMILTLPVADEREIMMKIMQYGSNARVLEPASLRTRIYEEAKAMAKDFEESQIEED